MEVVAVIVGDEEEIVAESAGAPKPPVFAVFLFFFLLIKRPLALSTGSRFRFDGDRGITGFNLDDWSRERRTTRSDLDD